MRGSARRRPAAAPPSLPSAPWRRRAAATTGGGRRRGRPLMRRRVGIAALGLAEAAQAAFDVGVPSADAPADSFAPAPILDRRLALRAPGARPISCSRSTVLVDRRPDAAHERIVYGAMKAALDAIRVARQTLLIPEIVELDEPMPRACRARRGSLRASVWRLIPSGLVRWRCARRLLRWRGRRAGSGSRSRRAPGRIGRSCRSNAARTHVVATMACHGSVRAGRRLKPEEMTRCCARRRRRRIPAREITAGHLCRCRRYRSCSGGESKVVREVLQARSALAGEGEVRWICGIQTPYRRPPPLQLFKSFRRGEAASVASSTTTEPPVLASRRDARNSGLLRQALAIGGSRKASATAPADAQVRAWWGRGGRCG